MSSLFDQFNGSGPAPTPVDPPQAPLPAQGPATDFISTETKAKAQVAAKVAREKTQATVHIVAQRANDTLAQTKERMAHVTVPKLSTKALGAGLTILVIVVGAGWWMSRTPSQKTEHAPAAAAVTVAPSTPASASTVTKAPKPAPVAQVAVTQQPAAPPPVAAATVTPQPVVATAPQLIVPPVSGPVTQPSQPVMSPSVEEINARWAKGVQKPKAAPKSAVKPQYEQDADAALDAWKKSH